MKLPKCFVAVLFLLALMGCSEDPVAPKPSGFMRIELGQHQYQSLESDCPFTFSYSKAAVTESKNTDEPCWINISYPQHDAKIHLSYKPVADNIKVYLEDARTLAYKHTLKASDIREKLIINDSTKVYGLLYEMEGNTASSIQFYLTDSSKHFVRGALYFNVAPNSDSLAPVISYIKEDVEEMIKSFRWK